MKAQWHLFYYEDNSFRSIVDGSPINLGMMLHNAVSASSELKASVLIAAMAILKDEGDQGLSGMLAQKIQDMLPDDEED